MHKDLLQWFKKQKQAVMLFTFHHAISSTLQFFLFPNLCVNFMLALLDADISFLLNLSVSSFTLRKSFIPPYQINWWLLMWQQVFSLYFTDKIETVRKELLWCKDRKDILLSWFDTKAVCTFFPEDQVVHFRKIFLFHQHIFQRQSVGIALFHEGYNFKPLFISVILSCSSFKILV